MGMNRIKKLLSSRFFIAVFVIVLEFAQLMAVYILLNMYSSIMTVLSYIFTACVIVYVINREELPEFKLPWLILFLVLPILGPFIYILFHGKEQTKKIKTAFAAASEKLSPYQQQNTDVELLREQNIDAYLQANYLYKAAEMPFRSNSSIIYYPIGEAFHAALLDALNRAEHFIFMEYFIIGKGVMWDSIRDILVKKVSQGVKVNVLYDDFGCMSTLPQYYYKELINEGIQCVPFNRIRPVLSQIYNNRDHRKITVIDGIVGFTGGINLADEYINECERFGHWKDTAVKIEGEAVKNLTLLFLSIWNTQSKDILESAPYLNVRPLQYECAGAAIPYGDGTETLYPDAIGRNVYLNMINNAKKYVYITTPYLVCDSAMLDALRIAAKKGVDVRIVMPGIPDKKFVFLLSRSNYAPLIRDGVKIYEYTPGFIHAKNFVSDDMFAVCGTINLDYRSLVHHFECGVWLYNVTAVQDIKADFIETSERSELITAEKANLTLPRKFISSIAKLFFPFL